MTHIEPPGKRSVRTRVRRLVAPLTQISARRIARGGERGWSRWLIPALVASVVLLAALNVRAMNQRAGEALDGSTRAQDVASAVQDVQVAQAGGRSTGVRSAQHRIDSNLDWLRGMEPGDADVRRLAAEVDSARAAFGQLESTRGRGDRRAGEGVRDRSVGSALTRLAGAADDVRSSFAAEAVDSQSETRRRSTWTILGGLLLVALLLWTFWAQRNSAESERRERRFQALLQNSSELVLVTSRNGRVRYASPALERMLGYPAAEAVDGKITDLVAADDRPVVTAMLEQAAAGHGETSAQWRALDAHGLHVDVEATCMNLLDDPVVGALVISIRDVAERLELEGKLRHQGFYDSLTELPNRALFEDRVRHAIAASRRDGGRVAVLFVDLDDFKTVNDSLGHAAGDELLRAVARRLHECTRASDTAARLGGDEFGVVVEALEDAESPDPVALRVHEGLSRPFEVAGNELLVRASIGIATSEGGVGGEELLRNADIAMYAAKADGKGHSETFRPSMHLAARKRLQVMRDLRKAVADGEFTIRYQPLVDLETERLLGLEALVRWQHPTLGEVPPADFIPLAEETGLIIPIGRYVLREACKQAATWGPDPSTDRERYVSVNLSARQFRPAGQIVEHVREATREAGLDPSRLMLEITESVLMKDPDSVTQELEKLKALGVRLAVDDFGTGYSALSYLRDFPIDTVKMDRSFVRDLARGSGDAALVRTVVDLGEALDMEIVAEGIEMRHQLDSLNDLRCDVGQGFYFARPLDIDGLAELLEREDVRSRDGAPTGAPG